MHKDFSLPFAPLPLSLSLVYYQRCFGCQKALNKPLLSQLSLANVIAWLQLPLPNNGALPCHRTHHYQIRML